MAKTIDAAIDGACRVLERLAGAAMAVMVLLVFGNVVLRYGFNSGITLSEELSRWLFVWMTFLGAVVALRRHEHLGTDLLVQRLGPRGKRVCYVLAHVLMLAVCGLLFVGAWNQAKVNLESTSAVMEASMAWLYAPGLLFALFGGVIVLDELVGLSRGRIREDELIIVQESEDHPQGPPPKS